MHFLYGSEVYETATMHHGALTFSYLTLLVLDEGNLGP